MDQNDTERNKPLEGLAAIVEGTANAALVMGGWIIIGGAITAYLCIRPFLRESDEEQKIAPIS